MEDPIKEMVKDFFNDEEIGDDEKKEMETHFELFLEALSSNDKKVEAMGMSILKICNDEKFTPFELSSMCATMIAEACRVRADHKGIESTKIFYERVVDAMNRAMDDMFKELEDGKCKDDDCSCKC